MLSQMQDREAQAPDAASEAPAAKSGQPTERGKAAGNQKTDKADKASKTSQTAQGEVPEKTEGENETVDRAAGSEPAPEAASADPALAEWLAALQRPVAPPQAADAESPAGGNADAGTQAAGVAKAAARGPLQAAGKDIASQEATEPARGAKAAQAQAEPAGGVPAESAAFQVALAQVDETRNEPKPVMELPSAPNTAVGVQPVHGTSRTGDAAATVSVQMATPAHAQEFPQSLGVQVSVLAKEGIQQAELHLNPAEMGPISVQIALDGTQAQVNFGADSAATRQIIERGLPELAASLREAGFTLSGGGVHSQARGREQGGDAEQGERGGRTSGGTAEKDLTVRRVSSRAPGGGIDLYA